MLIPSSVYFGGSRHPQNVSQSPVAQVVGETMAQGHSVHVGCQWGADHQVASAALFQNPSFLIVFAVSPNLRMAPSHVVLSHRLGARVVFNAGGTVAPIPARYLLRSIAAFQGCESAVFFSPGPGSLAVAREAVKAGLPVYAFGSYPSPIPSSVGFWVESSFMGFVCWQWQVTITQPSLF